MEVAYQTLAANAGTSVSMTEILRAAGLSTRAFYRHFDSKDGLLLAMFRGESDVMLARLVGAADAAPTPADALRGWIEEMLRITSSPARRVRAIVLSSEEVTRARGYPAERQRMEAHQTAGLARILARGRGDGTFPDCDPEPDARAVRAIIGQAFTDQMLGTAAADGDQAARQLTDFAFRAVGVGPHSSHRSDQ
jgi:AcrR family transcriptional regulator